MDVQVPCLFDLVRGLTRRVAASLPGELADRCPPGCKNNLRWQLGHIIVSAEHLVFGLAREPRLTPEAWAKYFAINTSPADFDPGTPSWAELVEALESTSDELLARVAAVDATARLPEPFELRSIGYTIPTRGGTIAMAIWHEGLHTGQMMTYGHLLAEGRDG